MTKDYSLEAISRRAELRDQEILKIKLDEKYRKWEGYQEKQRDYANDSWTYERINNGRLK